MTYSILGRDTEDATLGVAVQSKFPGVGSIVCHGDARAGVMATQAFANPDHARIGFDLLAHGARVDEVLTILARRDENWAERQVGVLGKHGPGAAHTGEAVAGGQGESAVAGSDHSLALGNTLSSKTVPDAMVQAFERNEGDLATRLIAALRAGRDAGGEVRGLQAAGLLVVKEAGGYGGRTGRHVDIQIYDHKSPIEELARCYRLHRLSYFPSEPDRLAPIDADLAHELSRLLKRRGFYDGPVSTQWTDDLIRALRAFMGYENYDNRLRDDAYIDLEVLEDIRAKHGSV
jgi:uncharacterized Ntn-hydrolase superfamily protein